MRIYIIGFMYSGKSTVGKKLANLMNLKHIDTDKVFETKYNITISSFFEKYGENLFRELEHKILLETIKEDNCIISTGGGLPCFHNNIEIIKENGISIYLNMSPISIIHRINNSKKKRPLLQNKSPEELQEYIEKLLKEREILYNQANLKIKGEDPNIKEIQAELISYIQLNNLS
ncbi:MAG TPA: shikimate kinase [Bacteroidales bacterium]|nr:shikimate kinase [Bacteroidales bacterium]